MKAVIEPGDRQFLQRLHEIGGGTVQEICADLGVTATAVRQRLVRLQGLKMVARERFVPVVGGRITCIA